MNPRKKNSPLLSQMFYNASPILAGASLSHGIAFLSFFLIAYLYTPTELAEYYKFLSLAVIITAFNNFGYDSTILVLKNQASALKMLIICLLFSLALGIIIIPILMFVSNIYFPEAKYLIYLIAIYAIFSSTNAALTAYSYRNGMYKYLAFSKTMETIIHYFLILLFGTFSFSTYGLIASCMIAIFIGILLLLAKNKFALNRLQDTFSISTLDLLSKHSNAIKYYAPATFIKNISENLHIILLSKFFPLEVVGVFAFAQKIMQVPAVIMNSLTQVLLKEFADSDSLATIKQIYHELYLKLWSFAILFITGTLILPNELMGFVFGEKWASTGEFTKLIAVWFASQLVATILAVIYIKLEKQYYLLIFNIINSILIVAAFVLLTLYNFDIYEVIILISFFKLFLNIVQTTVPYLLFKQHSNHD